MNKEAKKLEQEVLDSLLAAHPNFAGEGISWEPSEPHPDFIGCDQKGKRIGLELTEWLDSTDSNYWFKRQGNEAYLTIAMDKNPRPKPKQFRFVQINLKDNVRVPECEAEGFVKELYALMESRDAEASQRTVSTDKDSECVSTFNAEKSPLLKKYLGSLDLLPQDARPIPVEAVRWIGFPVKFLPHAPKKALKSLQERIADKTKKYPKLCEEKKLDELILLVHFGIRGFLQNPVITYEDDLVTITAEAQRLLQADSGPFTSAFLYLRFNEGKLIRLK